MSAFKLLAGLNLKVFVILVVVLLLNKICAICHPMSLVSQFIELSHFEKLVSRRLFLPNQEYLYFTRFFVVHSKRVAFCLKYSDSSQN